MVKLPKLKGWGRKKADLGERAEVPGASVSGSGVLGALSLSLGEEAGPGGYAAYRRMQQDPQVKACLSTKKFAVLSRGWEVHAASDSRQDKKVAEFVRWTLTDMSGALLDDLYDVLDALALGVSLAEINWKVVERGPWAGMVGLASLKAKDPGDFTFETDRFYNLMGLKGVGGAAYDVRKFLVYAYMPAYENPLGQSDLRGAWQSWRMKQQVLMWWAKYLEKFGMPTVVGTYDARQGYGRDQQRELLSVVAQVHNESALVLPSDMELKLLETARAGGAGFGELVEYLDRAMAKSILGQTLTSDNTGGQASYALGAVHLNILRFYLRKLQRDLEEGVMTEQVVRRLVGYNFGPGVACPRFTLGTIDDGQLAAAGTLITGLVSGNVIAPEEPWIREYLGLPARESGEVG